MADTGRLAVVDVDAFKLDVVVAGVRTSRVDAVLIRDHFPELHSRHSSHTHAVGPTTALSLMQIQYIRRSGCVRRSGHLPHPHIACCAICPLRVRLSAD